MTDWQPKPRVYTFYGFAEGRAIGKTLRRELRQAGYINTRIKSQADIIIAHSGGCLLVPNKNKARLILLVNPPFWPNKRVLKSWLQKIGRDYHHHREVRNLMRLSAKTVHNIRYAFTTIHRTLLMHKAHKILRYPEVRNGQNIVLIRNEHDPFCSPDIMNSLPQARHYNYRPLPGEHDDIWHYPKKYIELISAMLK